MKPWQEAEFLLEEQLDLLVERKKDNENTYSKEEEEIGSCILTMIALCQDVGNMPLDRQEDFWWTVSEEVDELLSYLASYLKPNH